MWSKHIYLWLYFSSPITNEKFETIFLPPSLFNFHDIRKSWFIVLSMVPSRRLLHYSSSIINVHFQRTMPSVINFCLFKEIYFSDAFYSRCIRATAISNSEKLFYIEPVATIWYLSCDFNGQTSLYPITFLSLFLVSTPEVLILYGYQIWHW